MACRYLKDDPTLAPKRSRPSYEGGSYGGYPAAPPPGVAPPPGAYAAYGPPAGSAPVGVVPPMQVRRQRVGGKQKHMELREGCCTHPGSCVKLHVM